MFNVKRLDDIRNKIADSTLLEDHEKADWLNLLELMNDKQLGELEEILAKENLSNEPEPIEKLPGNPEQSVVAENMPQLSHLANIPMGMIKPRPKPTPPPAPSPKPQQQQQPTPAAVPATPQPPQSPQPPRPKSTAPFDPTPPPPIIPLAQNRRHAQVNAPAPLKTKPAAALPTWTKEEVTPTPPPAPQPPQKNEIAAPKAQPLPKPASAPQSTAVPEPEPAPSKIVPNQSPYRAVTVDDLHQLTADSLRIHDWQSVIDEVKKFITEHGYFKVLQILETSPLYGSYLQAGKARFEESESDLTQEEFEFVADLLTHMRFNRW